MSAIEELQVGKSGAKRQIRWWSAPNLVSVMMSERQYNKRMQVYAYTAVTAILVALLLGVGWLYKVDRVQSTDNILLFILAQVLGVWVGLSNKIFRILNANPDKESTH